MKNSLLVTTTVLMMIQMLLTISCARHPEMDKEPEMDEEYYLEVQKARHEKLFPHGHGTPPSEGRMCLFNKATNSYFCGIASHVAQVKHHGVLLPIELDKPEKCLSCHGGFSAGSVNICSMVCIQKRWCPPYKTAFLDYPPKGKEKEFHSASELENAGLMVIGGQLTCFSCHNITNQEKFHLRINRSKKKMCRLCHKM